MREIKFRAWDNQEKVMINDGCIGVGSSCQLIIIGWNGGLSLCNAFGLPDGTNPTFDKPVIERFILMKFTGKTDLKGREIYEYDIYFDEIEFDDHDEREYYVCVWVNEWSRFVWLHIPGEYEDYIENGINDLEDITMIYTFGLEIDKMHYAGNIFETPELINNK